MTGQELKSKIVQLHVTQKFIAEKLGEKPQSVSSWLTAGNVSSETIEKVAAVLNKPVSYFYGEEPGNAIAKEHSIAAVNSNVETNALLSTKIDMLEKLLQEKDKIIEEKERTINILLNKNKATR